jgi:hypothetical protein
MRVAPEHGQRVALQTTFLTAGERVLVQRLVLCRQHFRVATRFPFA